MFIYLYISQVCQFSGSLLLAPCHDLKYAACMHGSSSRASRSLICTQNALSDLNSNAYLGWLSSCLFPSEKGGKTSVKGSGACASVLASCFQGQILLLFIKMVLNLVDQNSYQ